MSGAVHDGQLPLALELEAPATFETFVTKRDATALEHLKAAARGLQSGQIWLAGNSGTGKSHLLQAVCREADERGRRVMYLPLETKLGPTVLEGLEAVDCLALDGIDLVAGAAAWETALFPLFNHFHASAGVLVLAARGNPATAGFALPDLASRAAGSTVYRLHDLDDAGRLEALLSHARFRGLELDTAAAHYLLSRVRRGMSELCGWLDQLDARSLREQRRPTIPLIRATLRHAERN